MNIKKMDKLEFLLAGCESKQESDVMKKWINSAGLDHVYDVIWVFFEDDPDDWVAPIDTIINKYKKKTRKPYRFEEIDYGHVTKKTSKGTVMINEGCDSGINYDSDFSVNKSKLLKF